MRAAATLALLVALAVTSCSDEPAPTSAPPTATAATSGPARAQAAVVPLDDDSLVPAVMLGSVIRTPTRQVRVDLGGADPATFVQTQAGFVVQDTTGATYTVEDGTTTRIGRADASAGLALLVDTTGRLVAWVSPAPGGAVVSTYDAQAHARGPDLALPADGLPVVLDDGAAYYRSGPRSVTRLPVSGTPSAIAVPAGLRLVAATAGRLELAGGGRTVLVGLDGTVGRTLRPAATLSPTGAWAVASTGPIRVRDAATGADVTPDVSDAASRPLWVGADTFTVVTGSTPLISPPDSEVFHVDRCDVATGVCDNVIAVVTGAALSVIGLPVGATYPRG